MINHFGVYYKKGNKNDSDILSAMHAFTDNNAPGETIKKNLNNLTILISKHKNVQTSFLIKNGTFISYSGRPYLSHFPENDGKDMSGQILNYVSSAHHNNTAQNMDALKGTYNLTLYDTQKDRLFIISDVFGFYPLFYYNDDRVFAFCNEYQPLLKLKDALKPNSQAYAEYLVLGHTQNQHTLLKNINITPPNCRIKVNSKQTPSIKHLKKRTIKPSEASVEELAYDYYQLFKKEVELLLKWHPGLPLSITGGTDTRMVLGIMSEKERKSRQFFTYRTELIKDEHNNDIIIAKMIAERFNLKHNVLNHLAYNPHNISNDYFDKLSNSGTIFISGFFGSELLRFTASYPNNISEIARKHLKSRYTDYSDTNDPFINPDNKNMGKKPISFGLKTLKPYLNNAFYKQIRLSPKDILANIKHIKSPYPEIAYMFEAFGRTFFRRENGGAVSGQLMLSEISKTMISPYAIPELAFRIFGMNPGILQSSKDDLTNHILTYLPPDLLEIPSNSLVADFPGTVLNKAENFKRIDAVKTTSYNPDFLISKIDLLADTGLFNTDELISDIKKNNTFTHWWGNSRIHVWGDLIYWLNYIHDL
jgi:hypothetical protein